MTNDDLRELLCCPVTQKKLLDASLNKCGCKECGGTIDGSFICEAMYGTMHEYEHAKSVIEYWGKGWKNRELEHAHFSNLDIEGLTAFAKKTVVMQKQKHRNGNLWSTEIDPQVLNGKLCLNIGSGTGAEANLLITQGKASVIGIDITREARDATQAVLDKLGGGIALQADARHLPIQSECVDVVYSSGVLHHSKNIERSVEEIHRILKPGGTAFIGLYSNTSYHFLAVQLRGILKGRFSANTIAEYLSSNTEKSWRTGGLKNPLTSVFGHSDVKQLFKDFEQVESRKGGFMVPNKPILGKLLLPFEQSKLLAPLGNGIYIRATKARRLPE